MPLFLIGFMAAGKTSVGRALAAATNRRFVDLDDAIAATGVSVPELVARDQAAFRELEAKTLRGLDADIIATGGGGATYRDNLEYMRSRGLVVALNVDVDVAVQRAKGGTERPLLANAATLAVERAPVYRRAHAVVDTNDRSIEEVVALVRHVESVWVPGATVVALGDRSYPITVEDRLPAVQVAAVITDRNVAQHHRVPAGITITIEPGEASKTFATYERISNELVAAGLDRSSKIAALGGGVVGDLAGFVAATLYRGVPILQLPTTLVAMTDSAIGGKTAIDLPAGKNLVGAFWQPQLVACATDTLRTLPARERRAGFGELWKYALLDGRALWDAVADCAAWAAGPDGVPPPQALRRVIDRSIAYKAAIVGRDERERTGHRALLNLGHTVGHAIESASGMLHGEAVALGLVAACRVSSALLGTRADLADQVAAALGASGLAADLDRWLTEDVLGRITVDKKRIGANLRFIAIREVGACEPVEIAVTELSRILRPLPRA